MAHLYHPHTITLRGLASTFAFAVCSIYKSDNTQPRELHVVDQGETTPRAYNRPHTTAAL